MKKTEKNWKCRKQRRNRKKRMTKGTEAIINIELLLKVADDIVERGNNQFRELLTKKF